MKLTWLIFRQARAQRKAEYFIEKARQLRERVRVLTGAQKRVAIGGSDA